MGLAHKEDTKMFIVLRKWKNSSFDGRKRKADVTEMNSPKS